MEVTSTEIWAGRDVLGPDSSGSNPVRLSELQLCFASLLTEETTMEVPSCSDHPGSENAEMEGLRK